MANRKNWLGILVIALVFGMTVVSCGGDGNNSEFLNIVDKLNLKKTTPESTQYGLPSGLYNVLAGYSGYKGWDFISYQLEEGPAGVVLILVWTGQDVPGYETAKNALKAFYTKDQQDLYEDNLFCFFSGIEYEGTDMYRINQRGCSLDLNIKGAEVIPYYLNPDGYFCPAGTMVAEFYKAGN
jgi:hypothetical protein